MRDKLVRILLSEASPKFSVGTADQVDMWQTGTRTQRRIAIATCTRLRCNIGTIWAPHHDFCTFFIFSVVLAQIGDDENKKPFCDEIGEKSVENCPKQRCKRVLELAGDTINN